MSFKRLAPSTIIAVGVTTLITLGMAGMIKTEFTPQDKAEKLTFDINPIADEVALPLDRIEPQEVKRVETPPPPPVIERTQTSAPTVALTTLDGMIPDFDMPTIERDDIVITISDREVQPLLRISPTMPPRAEKSGHCRVRFNVSAEGAPYDVNTTYCTQTVFQRATIQSVQKWKFNPKIVNGRAVAMTGVENKVTYRLKDERGNIIPE